MIAIVFQTLEAEIDEHGSVKLAKPIHYCPVISQTTQVGWNFVYPNL
jgi:hypothetical protein